MKEKKIAKLSKEQFKKYVNKNNPDVKISILVEHRKKGFIKIPLSKHLIFQLYEWSEICNDECGNLKLNKVNLEEWPQIIEFLEFDVIGEGKWYDSNHKLGKKRYYLVKRPKYKKPRNLKEALELSGIKYKKVN